LAWHIEQRKKNKKHFNESLVGNWIFQMLLAVGFMHSNKIVHRDLKPQNIIFSSGQLKVLDFGICKTIDSEHSRMALTSQGVGTYWYLPP
jgi:tousled-like kinase